MLRLPGAPKRFQAFREARAQNLSGAPKVEVHAGRVHNVTSLKSEIDTQHRHGPCLKAEIHVPNHQFWYPC